MIAKHPEIWSYLPAVLLLVTLLVALTLAYRVWHEAHEDTEPVSDKELLSEFETAYAAGEIDQAELQRIRALLVGRPKAPVDEFGMPRPARRPGDAPSHEGDQGLA